MDSTTIHDLSSDDNQQPEKRKSEAHPEKLKDQTNIFIKKNDDVGGTSADKKPQDKQEDIDKKIHSMIQPINAAFELLFEEYKLLYDTESSKTVSENDGNVQLFSEGDSDFFAKFQSSGGFTSYNTKSELQKYLEDKEEAWYPSFDLLQWWKTSSSRYPILSKMAKG
ncbi:hypothetical protein E3N88_06059 [Mikania micrantha]|uniref:HAT C-terminal dimerisation domain-containing protein n=1 Tax=Mikania micrantha TaxID=192012 RepID=A0A5N6PMQ9_9ASTR|nr:hypothetical protein E3N88_06059 [Mikania micrantha]